MEPAAQHRLFVALSVPEPVRREIEREQADLKKIVPSRAVRWTRTEQLHLTLRFLGNVEASRVPELIAALNVACRSLAPLQLQAAGLGFFPEARRPRVLWVGVREKADQLSRTWVAMQGATNKFTLEEPERHFSGHITLARLSRLDRHETDLLATALRDERQKVFGEWTAREVELVRSQLSPQGARHDLVAAFDLMGR